ncbi:hypothetical protein ANCCEY_08732 [Ancylostoma ceylanicum]|uniref:Uncharacterized protein n=1 Tax=Ancylostoma ceylanicum TaxID=53326 RepID=A0A0D6LJJ7_9BILA|nr:hypothetical protein ANCCEY_08732 [Ancylostoma ceylanicum]
MATPTKCALLSSHGSGSGSGIMMSPQCLTPMTPPSHRSPAFTQQTQEFFKVLRVLCAVTKFLATIKKSKEEKDEQHTVQQPQPIAQPQSHSTPPHNNFGFGIQQQQQQQPQGQRPLHHQQQPQRQHQMQQMMGHYPHHQQQNPFGY